jgi:hypothetical protein
MARQVITWGASAVTSIYAETSAPGGRTLSIGALVAALAMVVLGPAQVVWAADPVPGEELLCTPTEAWAEIANSMFRQGKVTAAEEIFRSVQAADPTNECAVRGLAAVAAKAAADAAAGEESRTLPDRVGATWSDSLGNYFAPLGAPLLAVLMLLLVLLVLARLATPLAIGPDHRSWATWLRRAAWASGVILLLGAAAAPVVAGTVPLGTLPSWVMTSLTGTARVVTVAAVIAVIGLLVRVWWHHARTSPAPRFAGVDFLLWCVVIVGLLAALLWRLEDQARSWWWLTLFGAAAAVLGVGLVAASRGQVLRLTIDVRGASGSSDSNAAQYLVATLGKLGSERPKGLEVPEQTDVTALPADALTALPTTLPKAGFLILQSVRVAAPWRAVVGVADTSSVTISLTRNGRAAGSVTTLSRAELGLAPLPQDPAASDADAKALVDAAPKHLLIAAAAHILIELSRRHGQLQEGLYGATNSRSLAMQAIAGDPSGTVDSTLRRCLFAAAVGADPTNALARVSDLDRLGREPQLPDQLAVAAEADAEYARIKDKAGYGALQLRLLYTSAAARINALLLTNSPTASEQRLAADTVTTLVTRLDGRHERHMDDLVADLRLATCFLVLGAMHESPDMQRHLSEARTVVTRWRPANTEPLRAKAAYDRACWRATTRSGWCWQQAALDDLRIAATDEDLRVWARKDPSLQALHERHDQWTARFRSIVCDDPPAAFLDIRGIRPHRPALEQLGIHDAPDLLLISPEDLAVKLGMPIEVVRRWAEVARLVTGEPGAQPVPVGLVEVLVRLGVHSRNDLRRKVEDASWQQTVNDASADLTVIPPQTPDAWRPYVGCG